MIWVVYVLAGLGSLFLLFIAFVLWLCYAPINYDKPPGGATRATPLPLTLPTVRQSSIPDPPDPYETDPSFDGGFVR